METKTLGGYFELELNGGSEYHENAIALNTGRNALEYILRLRNYEKLYLPFFTCEVLLEPLNKLNVSYEFYHIDKDLEPIFNYEKIGAKDGFLYTNYFGIKDSSIQKLSINTRNLIIDNAQSFFSQPLEGIDTFYSPRKFFGVSDGAYLYIDKRLTEDFERDISYQRMSHLLIRSDINAEEGYSNFSSNDKSLNHSPIKMMSNLTHKLLSSIDYDKVKKRRLENFKFLHEQLNKLNQLKIEISDVNIPMVYPFWTKNRNLKNHLLKNKIYCATYWPNVLDWCEDEDFELQLMNEIVHLPIDQRYSEKEMRTVLELLKV